MSLEAVSGDSALGKALARIPAFLGTVKTAIQEQFTTLFTNQPNGLVVNFRGTATNPLVNRDYSIMRKDPARVPEGLVVDLLTYGHRLEAAAGQFQLVLDQMAIPLMRWINYNLSSPKSLAAVSSSLAVQGYKAVDLNKVREGIDKCFQVRGQLQTSVPYGQALRRNADWLEIGEVFESIKKQMHPGLHKQMVNTLKELEIASDTLHTRVTTDPEKYQFSQTAMMDLVKHLVAVAEAYDFYAQMIYRVQEYDHCLDETLKLHTA